ncbi:MAG: hypothetical protein B7X37_02115 [Halothiobacillus sp. 14-55-98]|jgi:uncharacterized protein (DUF1778 family)|nr:MAG: hypothetical protein B7X37_02115 [Halothiobacillus sp. 14-55-98]
MKNENSGCFGNQNAKKEHPKDAHIHIKLLMSEKARYVKAAQAEGKTLSRWLLDLADGAREGLIESKILGG